MNYLFSIYCVSGTVLGLLYATIKFNFQPNLGKAAFTITLLQMIKPRIRKDHLVYSVSIHYLFI